MTSYKCSICKKVKKNDGLYEGFPKQKFTCTKCIEKHGLK